MSSSAGSAQFSSALRRTPEHNNFHCWTEAPVEDLKQLCIGFSWMHFLCGPWDTQQLVNGPREAIPSVQPPQATENFPIRSGLTLNAGSSLLGYILGRYTVRAYLFTRQRVLTRPFPSYFGGSRVKPFIVTNLSSCYTLLLQRHLVGWLACFEMQ